MLGHDRLRHAGKGGEFIYHALDLAGLPLDGLRQLIEQFAVLADLLAEFIAQAFG